MTRQLEDKLQRRQTRGNLRQLKLAPSSLIDFSSNDYLGLARSLKLAKAVEQERERYASNLNGLGSTGSRLLTGNSAYAQALEDQIATFHGYEAGLLFNCGYMANVGLISAVANQDAVIFFDTHVHASTHDGIRLCRAKAFPYRHNDLNHLEQRLKHCSTQGDRFICTESIYSTDGSLAPLQHICQLAKQYDAHVIVDEAHAVGIFGPNGRGLVAKHNLTSQVFAQITTFGKALGSFGAIVLGKCTLKQALINFATSYIYTTALPFQNLATIKCSYSLFPKMEAERDHLHKLIRLFKGLCPSSSMTQIQAIPMQGNQAVKQLAELLNNQGFDARPLMSPTVQQGLETLRLCLHAFNSEHELSAISHLIQTHTSTSYA